MANSQMTVRKTIGVFVPLFIIAVLLTLNYSGCEKRNPIIFEGQLSGAKILLRLPDLDKPSQQGDFDITLTVCVQGGGSTVQQMEVKDYNVQGNLEVPAEKYLWIEAEAEIDTQMYRGESDTLFLSPGKITTVMITLDPAIGPTPNHPPNPPSSPHPPDAATEQPLNVVLSWSCSDPDSGDALTYDVYFGSDSIPPLVSSGESEKTYDPPENLEGNQTYYWKIVAMDSHYDQTVGLIWSFTTATDTTIVTFADPNLEQAVRDWIGKPTGDIYVSDVDTITYFSGDSANIQSLEGLEYFVSLNYLLLPYNEISDITPLQNLTQLTWLHLWDNQISDITPLQSLTQLSGLSLSENQISDITPLQSLTQLSGLSLSENQISDITPLENLTQLNWLTLYENQISDITPLENLTQLTSLYLWDNQISDITPLQNLTQLTGLALWSNQISDITPLENLTQLTGLYLWDNQISDITPLQSLTQLSGLNLSENQISDITALENLTQLYSLGLADNQISDITPLQNLTQLTWLDLWSNQISDITPLWNLTQLTDLNLDDNQISDITPVENLTQLTDLYLERNQIEDILPLVNNTGMDDGDEVWLIDNPLSDTSIYEYIPQLEARGVTVYY